MRKVLIGSVLLLAGLAALQITPGLFGAGVLVISLSWGIGGLPTSVVAFSMALNAVLTGAFIVICRRLIRSTVVSAGTRT